MVVLGDATEGAGLHKVKVHKVTGNEVPGPPALIPRPRSVFEFCVEPLTQILTLRSDTNGTQLSGQSVGANPSRRLDG